jgi:hypothetical protein
MPSASTAESTNKALVTGRAILDRSQREDTASGTPERRLALIHRVIVPDVKCPREYAILVTDRRSIFIRLERTRSSFVLRGEMRYGTALVTDVKPKSLEDCEQSSLESLTADSSNLVVSHEALVSMAMRTEEPEFRLRDLFIWLTMRRQGEVFQVYNFEMSYRRKPSHETAMKFYLVPLGAYFKPRRQTKSREMILREYALEALNTFRNAIPFDVISS